MSKKKALKHFNALRLKWCMAVSRERQALYSATSETCEGLEKQYFQFAEIHGKRAQELRQQLQEQGGKVV